MPLVQIDVLEGRTKERLLRLIEEVTTVVARTLEVPAERVRVIVREVDPDLWGIGGVPASRRRGGAAGGEEPAPRS